MTTSVLLVDDEAGFVETLAKRLTLRRFIVHTATRADRLFSILNETAVDVVVLDVRMPDLDGIAATKAIKATHPLVEVILLTGHASIEASISGMQMGAFDYLLKPVNLDELVYKIEDAYRKKQLQERKVDRLADEADGIGGPR